MSSLIALFRRDWDASRVSIGARIVPMPTGRIGWQLVKRL
jgi:hypothetical protein